MGRLTGFDQLRLALSFLTRVPVGSLPELEAEDAGQSALWYPMVGLLIGLLQWLVAIVVLPAGAGVAAATAVVTGIVISGALHLDGLADLADGWIGGQGDRERTLRIMQDPVCGPVAVSVIVGALLLQFSALDQIASSAALGVIILAPVLARSAILVLLMHLPYARQGGLGETLHQTLPHDRTRSVLIGVALLCILVWGWTALMGLLVVAVAIRFYSGWLRRLLGGVTGDALGAGVVMVETLALLAAAWMVS
jgi:adenosylcobinamide-GDP ribazoletransferase